jgi:hypothetical protein
MCVHHRLALLCEAFGGVAFDVEGSSLSLLSL